MPTTFKPWTVREAQEMFSGQNATLSFRCFHPTHEGPVSASHASLSECVRTSGGADAPVLCSHCGEPMRLIRQYSVTEEVTR